MDSNPRYQIIVTGKYKFETSHHCTTHVEVRTLETSLFVLGCVLDEQANQTSFLFLCVGLEKTQLWGIQNKIHIKAFHLA